MNNNAKVVYLKKVSWKQYLELRKLGYLVIIK